MKYSVFIASLFLIFGCGNNTTKNEPSFFHETELSFLHIRYGYDKENNWIKKPENILKIHETFKKFGYKKLFNDQEWNDDWNWYLDVSKSPKNLFDSLELTYRHFKSSPKYYKEFWERRKKEENAETVFEVVKEINHIMNSTDAKIENKINYINDTLFNLLTFEFPRRELTDKEANLLLEYLIKIGLHESAFNLINEEHIKFENVNWNDSKENYLKQLNKKDKANQLSPWFQDDVK